MAEPSPKSPSTPAKPTNLPRPGTVPKLPQTIFNLEKRGSAGNVGKQRAPRRPGRG
jgi:hypothetical protein